MLCCRTYNITKHVATCLWSRNLFIYCIFMTSSSYWKLSYMNMLNYCGPLQNKHAIFLDIYKVKQNYAKKCLRHILQLLSPSPGPDSEPINHSSHPHSTGASLTRPARLSPDSPCPAPRPRPPHDEEPSIRTLPSRCWWRPDGAWLRVPKVRVRYSNNDSCTNIFF